MDLIEILLVIGRVLAVFVLLVLTTIFNIWLERKIVAGMQNRIGPDRVGPWGMFQTIADALKLLFKEQITPTRARIRTYLLAPFLAVVPAFLLFLMVPLGPTKTVGGREIPLYGADLDTGILFLLAVVSMSVFAVILAGWSSGSQYPFLGGFRGSSQAISYGIALSLAMVSVVVYSSAGSGAGEGTMSLVELVNRQSGHLADMFSSWGFLQHPPLDLIPAYNVFLQFGAFIIFMIAAFAACNRSPFDIAGSEQELVGGPHSEYSGIRFAMFYLAEYVSMFSMSAIAATLFLGGWHGNVSGLFGWEFPGWLVAILPPIWLLLKTYLILFIFFWIRATLPRVRFDQLMSFGWKRLIPASLGWLALTSVVVAVDRFGVPWA